MPKMLYKSPLSCSEDIRDFASEGSGTVFFEDGALKLDSSNGKEIMLWYPKVFPSDVKIEWEFKPLSYRGQGELFFAAKEAGDGSISALRLSYYRRNTDKDRAFHTCELRKTEGYYLAAEGADPIPDMVGDTWYSMCIEKKKSEVSFSINGLKILEFNDDGRSYGEVLTGGSIGLGQGGDTVALYRNLSVTWI